MTDSSRCSTSTTSRSSSRPGAASCGRSSTSTSAVAKGETVGIVGESGSGKSVTSYAVMRILDRAGRIADGSVHVHRHRRAHGERKRDARPARPRNLDDLPEPARGAQSDPQGRPPDRGRAAAARPGRARAASPRRRSRSSTRCASRARASATTPIRSSCPAACASAS